MKPKFGSDPAQNSGNPSDRREVLAAKEKLPQWSEVVKTCSAYKDMRVTYLKVPHRVNKFVKDYWGKDQHGVQLFDAMGLTYVMVTYGKCDID